MTSFDFSLPEQKNYEEAYRLSRKLALEKLASITDFEAQCRKSGAQFQIVALKKSAIIKYLNHFYTLSLPEGVITPVGESDPLSERDELVVLHYFVTAKGTPLSGKLITFGDLPEGVVYQPTFIKRTIQPILKNFGMEPDTLLLWSREIGGYRSEYGDMSITVNAFKNVPVTFVVWQGDDEFPPRGSVLFDSTITDYLPTEDITVLCELITWRLVSFLRQAQT
jgi:hypothetical protein